MQAFYFQMFMKILGKRSNAILGAHAPDFDANGSGLPKNEWKSISIRIGRLVCVKDRQCFRKVPETPTGRGEYSRSPASRLQRAAIVVDRTQTCLWLVGNEVG